MRDPESVAPHTDWISFLLALGISHLPFGPKPSLQPTGDPSSATETVDLDAIVALYSHTISLFLTALLILSSLAQVLKSLSRVLKLTSKTVGTGFLLLSLGQLFVRSPLTFDATLTIRQHTSYPS